MAKLNYDRNTAARHLIRKDQQLGRFISGVKETPPLPKREVDLFLSLSRSIVYQQLSGKAAATIFSRFAGLFPNQQPSAGLSCNYSVEKLRSVGLSRNKALAVLDLADKIETKQLPGRRRLLRMSDMEIIDTLTIVRGIGPWTAQMFLIFNLGRADVMPAGDLAIRKGFQQLMQLEEMPDEAGLLLLTEHWKPYRSAAAWYLWRVVDGDNDW
ncbi:MAG: DNA-3-methyladenine glycosylase 2 family protein [Proteobacteria bacterium]|nr:DNA-3-methyladenine glycosylase 2 family protein [Pseudomonadota bacterium]